MLTCEWCRLEFPIDQFPNLREGTICSSCMQGRDPQQVQEALMQQAKHVSGQLLALNPGELGENFGKVKGVLSDIYGKFGGTSGFAEHLYWVISQLSARDPVPPSVGHLMLGLMKLHHTVEQTEAQVTATEMSDEQLRRETELATVKMFIESAGDPSKRKMLDQVLGKHGLTIQTAKPEDITNMLAEEMVNE